MPQIASDGKVYLTIFYNLDFILAVAYRVKGGVIQFRTEGARVQKVHKFIGEIGQGQ